MAGSSARRLMMTAFGWNDSGGGTTVPRLVAKELARRGWEVTVFHAAVATIPGAAPYQIVQSEDDGVNLIGIHNRPHGLFDYGHPLRELDDPPITAAFSDALDRVQPQVIHFHNLHNLGAALLDQGLTRGLPAYFSTHNYWLICPRAYLLRGDGSICSGPGDGSGCARCVGSHDASGHEQRLIQIRATAERSLRSILAVSDSVRQTLLAAGYPPELVDVVRQAMPHEADIWERVGRERAPGRRDEETLTVAFLGSAYPHKGPQLLVQAAQETQAEIRVRILGEVPPPFAASLKSLDRRGVVDVAGAFAPDQIGELLREVDAVALPSMWWDCAPLAAAECLAAGTPLLVPRLGGLPEAIRDGVDGLTFKPLDAGDLARQLDRLALEPGLLERLQDAIDPPGAFSDYVDELEAYYAGERPGRVDTSQPPSAPAVRWRGDHGFATSLSIINDRVIERLDGSIQRIAAEGTPLDPPLVHSAEVEVRHQWPPDLSPPAGGRLAVIQPWEFGAIPANWVDAIEQHVDELWVPSEFVRRMYLEAGIPADRVVSIPNGVDPERFTPAAIAGERTHVRFLFVGGVIWRKGPDVLLKAWQQAFPERDDVTLTIKDFGATSVYRNAAREPLRDYVASARLPRVELIEDELSPAQLIELYRSCDVLVHPYRGEGFAMPVLEAMACGLPVIVTAGGPTDEFCPPEAGWRIRSQRAQFPTDHVDSLATRGRPWVLEPDADHLVQLLREAAADGGERLRRGANGRAVAERYSWDAIAGRYRERLRALAARPPRVARGAGDPWPLSEPVNVRVLATPAWRGEDELGQLLHAWTMHTTRATSACLYLLADPALDGRPEELETRVLEAAHRHGADIDTGADINVLMEPRSPELAARLHAAIDAYIPLHPACAGHERIARMHDNVIAAPESDALTALLRGAGQSTEDLAA